MSCLASSLSTGACLISLYQSVKGKIPCMILHELQIANNFFALIVENQAIRVRERRSGEEINGVEMPCDLNAFLVHGCGGKRRVVPFGSWWPFRLNFNKHLVMSDQFLT